ncbi:hypothetical protein L596_008357 [Steinernema carpocapsae]|uniref:Uncharacterized protein n=1 Tax=Steinernema carpocapsae TaxID=34508 RepID=A0A4U5PCI2_STECR|nr:hypothetical protein L596_008357 [Steinernema carpocapsae]
MFGSLPTRSPSRRLRCSFPKAISSQLQHDMSVASFCVLLITIYRPWRWQHSTHLIATPKRPFFAPSNNFKCLRGLSPRRSRTPLFRRPSRSASVVAQASGCPQAWMTQTAEWS